MGSDVGERRIGHGSRGSARRCIARLAEDLGANREHGYVTQQTTALNPDGSTSIDVKAFMSSGSLANETISTNGNTVTFRYDDTGDGIFDRTQTDVTVNDPHGSQTVTISNYDVSGALTSRQTTTTSADGKTVKILRDQTGGGIVDQTGIHTTNADGSTVVTTSRSQPSIAKGDRLGLVAANRCGKSSLLRVMAGEEDATTGTLTRAPRGCEPLRTKSTRTQVSVVRV